MLSQPEPACLVIADITGYTGFLAGAELPEGHGRNVREPMASAGRTG